MYRPVTPAEFYRVMAWLMEQAPPEPLAAPAADIAEKPTAPARRRPVLFLVTPDMVVKDGIVGLARKQTPRTPGSGRAGA